MDALTLKKAFESKKSFAVPARLIEPDLDKIRAMMGRTIHARSIEIMHPTLPVEVDAYLFPGTIKGKSCRKLLFGEQHLLSFKGEFELFEARTDDRIIPIVIPTEHRFVAHDIESIQKMDMRQNMEPHEQGDQPRALAWTFYQQDLILFSRLTGYKIEFEPIVIGGREEQTEEKDSLYLSVTIPNGDVSTRYAQVLFGHRMTKKGDWEPIYNPTRGRGFIIQDPAGEAVAQIIGRTANILFPIFSTFHEYGSREIFQKTLVAIWKTWRAIKKKKLKPYKEASGFHAFARHVVPRFSLSMNIWVDLLKEKQSDIQHTIRRLESLYRQEMEYRDNIEYFSNDERLKKQIQRVKADFLSIKRHPLTQRVYICDKGVQVETKLVRIEHEGKTYDIGRFVIRFGGAGELTIWPIEMKHLLQVPHPHIRKGGIPCFGTASSAIAKATGQLRFADAYHLIAQWITSYTPATVSTPIEEWRTPENDETIEQLLPQLTPPKNLLEEDENAE